MAWTYSDYDDDDLYPTSREKISRGRKFLRELRDAVSADVARDGASRSSQSINQLIDTVEKRISELSLLPDARDTGTIGRTRLG